MSHETESPAPPVDLSHGDGPEPAEGDPRLPLNRAVSARPPPRSDGRPRQDPSLPYDLRNRNDRERPRAALDGGRPCPRGAPGLAEVAEAMAFVDPGGDGDEEDPLAPRHDVRPRPSETMVGSTSPLHTADDANTVVDASSLTPGDAERIIAAADAERAATGRRPAKLLPGSAALPAASAAPAPQLGPARSPGHCRRGSPSASVAAGRARPVAAPEPELRSRVVSPSSTTKSDHAPALLGAWLCGVLEPGEQREPQRDPFPRTASGRRCAVPSPCPTSEGECVASRAAGSSR